MGREKAGREETELLGEVPDVESQLQSRCLEGTEIPDDHPDCSSSALPCPVSSRDTLSYVSVAVAHWLQRGRDQQVQPGQ